MELQNSQLVKVRLTGYLAEVFIEEITLLAKNTADIIRGLRANFSNFDEIVKPGQFHIYKRGVNDENIEDILTKEELPEDSLQAPLGTIKEDEVIYITPVIEGGGGFLKIILGIALIGAALLIPGAGFLLGIGASLFIGGLTSLFAPTNKTPKKYEKQDSHLFNDAPSTGFEADPIPLLYGEYLVANVPYISSSITKVPTYQTT